MHTTCWSWLIAVDNWKRRHRTGKLQKRKGVKGRFRHKGHLMSPTSNVLCFICWPVDTSSFLFAGPAFDFFAVLDPLHRWRWCVTFYRVYNGSILTYCFLQNYPFFFLIIVSNKPTALLCLCRPGRIERFLWKIHFEAYVSLDVSSVSSRRFL